MKPWVEIPSRTGWYWYEAVDPSVRHYGQEPWIEDRYTPVRFDKEQYDKDANSNCLEVRGLPCTLKEMPGVFAWIRVPSMWTEDRGVRKPSDF